MVRAQGAQLRRRPRSAGYADASSLSWHIPAPVGLHCGLLLALRLDLLNSPLGVGLIQCTAKPRVKLVDRR